MRRKYLLHPGWVTSQTDGGRNFISEAQLIRLYGVRREECVSSASRLFGVDTDTLIDLRPRYDGDYSLPERTPGGTP